MKMPKERKEDRVNDSDSGNPMDRDHGSSHKSIAKSSDKPSKKLRAAKSSPTRSSPSASKMKISRSQEVCVDFRDPKIQTAMLLGLLAIMAVALWYGFTQGCFRRRRRHSCWLANNL